MRKGITVFISDEKTGSTEVSPHTRQNDHHQKNLQKNAGEGVEKRELSNTVGGNDTVTMENSKEVP